MRRTVRWGLRTGEPSPDPDGLSPDRRSGFEDVGNPPASLPAVPPAGRASCCEIDSRASGRHFLLRRMRRSQTRIHGRTLHVANAMQPLDLAAGFPQPFGQGQNAIEQRPAYSREPLAWKLQLSRCPPTPYRRADVCRTRQRIQRGSATDGGKPSEQGRPNESSPPTRRNDHGAGDARELRCGGGDGAGPLCLE